MTNDQAAMTNDSHAHRVEPSPILSATP